jgi:polar amino acid transport system substrate-binding protein
VVHFVSDYVFSRSAKRRFNRRRLIGLGCIFGCTLAVLSAGSQIAKANENTTMTFATTDTYRERVRVSEGKLPMENPGWFVELSSRAARQCGANIEFVFLPWARVLQRVESGEIHAAFNSSYKEERTKYGVYPLKAGIPDKSRASKAYAYLAYTRIDSSDVSLTVGENMQGRTIAAERQASIIPELIKRGAEIYETASFETMLRMLANHRVDAVVGIEDNLDGILDQNPELAQVIIKLNPPVVEKIGYVMFSKIYYAGHQELVECFWSSSAQLRDTPWFEQMRASYN